MLDRVKKKTKFITTESVGSKPDFEFQSSLITTPNRSFERGETNIDGTNLRLLYLV